MLDHLPHDVLASIIARTGRRPESVHAVCRATWRVALDERAVVLWVSRSFPGSEIFTLSSVTCVNKWTQNSVLTAFKQLFQQGFTLQGSTHFQCVCFWAQNRGHDEVLKLLLENTPPSLGPPSLKAGLLKAASAQGNEGCVRVLVEKGADPNTDNGRPLKAAAEAGSAGVVRALLSAGADVHAGDECALRVCAAAGSAAHVEAIAVLLEHGADVHAKHDEALSLAVERSNVDVVALLLKHGADARARQILETAAATGCARAVRLLLASGADADADGGRPLRAAAGAGALEVVQQLLDAGARLGRPLQRRTLGVSVPRGHAGLRSLPAFGATPGSCPPASSSTWWPVDGGPSRAQSRGSSLDLARDDLNLHSCASTGSAPLPTTFVTQAGPGLDHKATLYVMSSVPESEVAAGCDLGCDEVCVEGAGDEGGEVEDDRGSGALCAALCAGEGEVARVLLERGACMSPSVLRCWRQWHRYPGIMAVLHRHPPHSSHTASPPPTTSTLGGAGATTPQRPPGCVGCACCGSAAALAVAMRQELAAAAGEGAEAAVRLFLFWAAPQPAEEATAEGLGQPTNALSTASNAQHSAGDGRSSVAGSSWSICGPAVTGALDAGSLAQALHSAVVANHPVVVGQLLHHSKSPMWCQAVMRPAALLAAVERGHVDILRLLLAAGAAPLVLRARCTSAAASCPHAPTSANTCAAGSASVPPPPPPLQAESWGAAVLCSAAACKRGPPGSAQAMVDLLLGGGFGTCAQDAMRLVACGRVPPWSESIANTILDAAFSAMSVV